MGTEILESYGVLQSELEQARSSLKGVDENIKRLIGRDPSEILPRAGVKRGPPVEENNRNNKRAPILIRNRNFNHENEEHAKQRRPQSVFKRLSDRPPNYEDELAVQSQKQIISKVIVTPREVPSRQEALAAQSIDEKSKARNRRMFGALLGTLQKFQQEETKLKSKEQKRAQVEKKIEEHEIREKAEIKKERQELFFNRKKKQAEIKMIELKMLRMKEYAVWEERQKPRANFILTKAKPHICFLPRRLNAANKTLLESSKVDVENLIEKRKQEVFLELQHIEDRMKRNFESRKAKDSQEEEPPEDGEPDHEMTELQDELLPEEIKESESEITNNNVHETTVPVEQIEETVEHKVEENTVKEDEVVENQSVVESDLVKNDEVNNKNEEADKSDVMETSNCDESNAKGESD